MPTKLLLVCCYWLCFVFALFVVSDKYFRLQKVQTQFQATKLLPDFCSDKSSKRAKSTGPVKIRCTLSFFSVPKAAINKLDRGYRGTHTSRTLPHNCDTTNEVPLCPANRRKLVSFVLNWVGSWTERALDNRIKVSRLTADECPGANRVDPLHT